MPCPKKVCGIFPLNSHPKWLSRDWAPAFFLYFFTQSGCCGIGLRHSSCKFQHKMALVTCPCEFPLRRLAQLVFPDLGIGFPPLCSHMCAFHCLLSSVCSHLSALICVLSSVCFHMCALRCVLSCVCSHMCALISVLSYLCSHMCAPLVLSSMCSHLCALISVLSSVCSHMCAFICVLSYVCFHACALICVLSYV